MWTFSATTSLVKVWFAANGEEPQKGDIFFMQYGKMPDHCAVYIGDDQILHHHKDRLSCRAVFGGMYKSM